MVKPKKKIRKQYDYLECSHYLEKKYKYAERDYGGKGKFCQNCKKETDEKFGENGWWTVIPDQATPAWSHSDYC